ncbi:MAG TPA: hypothetical protein PK800_09140 [Syntrophorhabdaceae bacterium]|nr:hypothetical protein [Syntrophorhabdaceae bacterium]
MRINIFSKIMAAFIVIVILLGLSLPVIAFKTIKRHYISTFTENLKNITFLLKPEITDFFKNRRLNEIDGFVKSFKHDVNARITVIDRDGTILADSEKDPKTMENHKMRPEFIDAISGRIGTSIRFSVTVEEKMLYVAIPIVLDSKILGVLRVSTYLKDIEILLSELRLKIFLLTLILATIAFIIIYFCYSR